MQKILLLDNYDSFTYNIVQQVQGIKQFDIVVKRNDETINNSDYQFDILIISPGPKTPNDAGISKEIIKKYYKIKPILGVCLGMQCINEVFGGKTIQSDNPMHGKISHITHTAQGIFKNVPQNIGVARYHSLLIDKVSDELSITALANGKIPMAIQHKKYPVFGVQFHPESFLTQYGNLIMKNFLKIPNQKLKF